MDYEDHGRLGRYDLIATLAREDCEDVYLAARVAPAGQSKLAVIKELHPQLATDTAYAARFLDDARVASLLNHANIVETLEAGEDRGRPFVATEYLEGQTLERVVDRVGPAEFPRAMWLRVLADVLAGLHHAHEATGENGAPLRMAHLRLSARRVFISYDGQVKVLDFGRPAARSGSHPSSSSLARANAYVAPEQARSDEPADRRADVYAVGVLLWEASTRKPMWGGLSDAAIMEQITSGKIPSLREADPDVPPPLGDIVARALAPNPEDRYSTAMHMQIDLEGFLRASGAVPTSREIGRIVAQAFLDERLRATTVIDEQLRRLRARAQSGGAERVSLLRLEAAHPISGPVSSSDPGRSMSTTPRAFTPSGAVLGSPEGGPNGTKRRRLLWAAGVAAILVALAGAFALRGSSQPPPVAPESQAPYSTPR